VVVVQLSRQEVVDALRRAGLGEEAEEAMVKLPDPVDLEQVQDWGMERGITADVLVSQMGGSP
jgi:hypothetical protein